jgi:tetratricopeptide (TPR) repeat protein
MDRLIREPNRGLSNARHSTYSCGLFMRRRLLPQLFLLLLLLNSTSAFAQEYYKQSLLAEMKGDYATALKNLNAAVAKSPRNSLPYHNRAVFYYRQRKYKLALSDLDMAIRLQRTSLFAAILRADVYAKLGDYARALKEYNHLLPMLGISDLRPMALNGRAWLEATCPDSRVRNGQQAVIDAKKAVAYGGPDKATYLGTLAAAYAETGDFDSAIRYEQEAMTHQSERDPLPDPTGPMKAYRQHRPYRANPPTSHP